VPGAWLRRLCGVLRERGGSVSPLLTIMLVPMIAAMGMATESSSWFFVQRAAQNAADAAVLAAASNDNAATNPTYIQEAQGVATQYGFTDSAANATVTAVNNATCPAPSAATNCYKVTVTKKVPIALTTLVGYNGNTDISGQPAVLVTASAMASRIVPASDCIRTKVSFRTNGTPNFNAGGCTLFSDGSTTCNGNDLTGLGFNAGFAIGTDKKCGVTSVASGPPDPFASTLANNPPSGCKDYGTTPPTGGGTLDWSAYPCVTIGASWNAGTTKILTDTSSANKGTVLYMQNGANIALTGKLQADFGQGLTIVFTNASGATPGFLTGNGTIDYGAPTSGPWSGVALYQNPLAGASNVTYSGNSPTFNITGLIYAPNASMTFQGAINHETSGYACIAFYVSDLLISGTGSIFANPTSQCNRAGLNGLPTAPNTVTVRQALVQ